MRRKPRRLSTGRLPLLRLFSTLLPITLIDIGFRRTNDASLRYRLITTAPNSFGVRLWSVKRALPLLTLTLIGSLRCRRTPPKSILNPHRRPITLIDRLWLLSPLVSTTIGKQKAPRKESLPATAASRTPI